MRFPKPWHRKGRGWFITFDRQQIKLGRKRKESFERYQQLIAKPKKRSVPSDSLLTIIDSFLDWCEKHRAPDALPLPPGIKCSPWLTMFLTKSSLPFWYLQPN